MFGPSSFCTFLFAIVLLFLLLTSGGHGQDHDSGQTTGGGTTATFEQTLDEFLKQATDKDGLDLQVSTCKISSQQLVATAQATAARVLNGVCNRDEIEDRFVNMETQLGDQLNVVKAMLLSLEEKIVDQDQELKRQYRRILGSVSGSGSGSGSSLNQKSSQKSRSSTSTSVNVTKEPEDLDNTDDDLSQSSTKSGRVGPRSDEISRYNSTVHIESGRRVFSYYWILTGMGYKVNNWNQKRALRSSSFYIFPEGYRLYMRIIPRYTASTMYIHVGITKGDFDDSLSWPFTYNLRIQVLAQDVNQPKRVPDLKSRIWNPRELCSGSNWRKPLNSSPDNAECVGLGFPHDVIKTPEYIWNDRLIVKLTAYLD